MMQNKETKTRMTFENNDNRYIWESPYSDVTMDDILNAFFGMMVSATWQPSTIIKIMKEYVEEHEYIINDEIHVNDFIDDKDFLP